VDEHGVPPVDRLVEQGDGPVDVRQAGGIAEIVDGGGKEGAGLLSGASIFTLGSISTV